jgi:hypothetical protein
MTQPQPSGPADGVMAAAVLKLTDLAARVERVEQSAGQRIGELATSCDQALAQVASLRQEAGTRGRRADGIEAWLAEAGALLARMSGQIDGLTTTAEDEPAEPAAAYRVHPAPPWWQPRDHRCAEVIARETTSCRSGGHRDPGQPAAPAVPAWLTGHR